MPSKKLAFVLHQHDALILRLGYLATLAEIQRDQYARASAWLRQRRERLVADAGRPNVTLLENS